MTWQKKTLDPDWAWSHYEPTSQNPWDRRRAAHLLRRAGFGGSPEEVAAAADKDPGDLVKQLLRRGEKTEQVSRQVDQLAATILNTGSAENLAGVWLYRLLHTPDQLTEKTTLFWHGHFATSAAKVSDAHLMHQQNELLREHAVGDFKAMVQGISRDPAMLIYLDSVTNRKSHPNENYAREIMELFCLGEGNYSEKDVQQLARCFTGWEVRRGKFRFNRFQHDFGEKQLLGMTGKFTGEQAIDIVLRQPAAPRFIAQKLVRYFVFDEPVPSVALIQPLADQLRQTDFHVGPVIERILTSNLFFSEHAYARKVRSPVELAVNLIRGLNGSVNVIQLSSRLQHLGQRLFFPPNVKGWDGGRTWINSSTLLGRANLVHEIINDPKTRFEGGTLQQLLNRYGIRSLPDAVPWLADALLAVSLPEEVLEQIVAVGRSTSGDFSRQIAAVIHTMATQPEFQLN